MTGKLLQNNSLRQTMNAIGAKSMADIGDLYKSFDVVAIDEGQFFPDVSIIADNQFKIVSWSD